MMKRAIWILVLLAVMAAPASAEWLLDDPSLRMGWVTSLEGEGSCKAAIVPNKIAVWDIGDVKLSLSADFPILLMEDPSILKVTHVTAGGSLILSSEKASGSLGLTYTERYGFSVSTTLVQLSF